MDHIFAFRNQLIADYRAYVDSFVHIRDPHIQGFVQQQLDEGALWPDPLIQFNPLFAPGKSVEQLVQEGVLHKTCAQIFRRSKSAEDELGQPLQLHQHQEDAVRVARTGASYVLTTGTGSGKSLAYILPIVDHVLRVGSGKGVQAIIVYPMNALANSQIEELKKFLDFGNPDGRVVTFARYTGQEDDDKRNELLANPPDIILTNYVMLELILTRVKELRFLQNAALRFLVLDELHTYRGRQGADVALLVRRVRNRLASKEGMQCVGTSATLATSEYDEDRQREVAHMASLIFGTKIQPEHIIGETLQKATNTRQDEAQLIQQLTANLRNPAYQIPADYQGFLADPLSIWIERTFGVTEKHERIERVTPRSISGEKGAARQLSQETGVPVADCERALQTTLLAGYDQARAIPATGRPPFAFRLHQFITKGDTLFASLERAGKRYLTMQGQVYVPDGTRQRVLLPLVFCRECGQEYYVVRIGERKFVPRQLRDHDSEEGDVGFLYASQDNPWPDHDENQMVERLPEDWIEEWKGGTHIKSAKKRHGLPKAVRVHLDGTFVENNGGPLVSGDGLAMHFVPTPFSFCLHCGVVYGSRQKSDFSKLAELSSEGRSTATTILCLSAIRHLKEHPSPDFPAKLLSFTDNRQDASLQAGHFNDFIEIGILRAALYRAVREAGPQGLSHDNLTARVFDALALPFKLYANEPDLRYAAQAQTQQALRDVLGYRLYADLKRGWRLTSPNLEQTGLLKIAYLSLTEICSDAELWQKSHDALRTASPETREHVCKVLLDYMRRELAIEVDYLNQDFLKNQLRQRSSQRLAAPWAIDENENFTYAATLFPRSVNGDYRGNVYLSDRSSFGMYLKRDSTFPAYFSKMKGDEAKEIIRQLLEALRKGGCVNKVVEPNRKDKDPVPGYQLSAAAIQWHVGDGIETFVDPLRNPRASSAGHGSNAFFVEFYKDMSAQINDVHAFEHTAQVPAKEREEREQLFRAGELPVLYCSPTMELGVDIAELNLVHLRNMPPTPANYAQRSGRAGRSGQPALVLSYCSTGSAHDQYFFKRPEQMVMGQVTPPRLDLANEDLVRSHIHAIWLAETGLSLGKGLPDILDITNEQLALRSDVQSQIQDDGYRKKAEKRASAVLATFQDELQHSDWYQDDWLERTLKLVAVSFDDTANRWRKLYQAARAQRDYQTQISRDPARSMEDREKAEKLRTEAVQQEFLLTDPTASEQADFNSYRYFASEGFLPGYNFARLPLSAYIPGRKLRQQKQDSFLQRSRFLAIAEFGPRAIVYHEGSKYEINRVILARDTSGNLTTTNAKQCTSCGYLHQLTNGNALVDVCDACGVPLNGELHNLYRLENVATRRRDKINSDEEERTRLGFEIRTAVRFDKSERGTRQRVAHALTADNTSLARLTFGQAATLWRVNLGWKRRKDQNIYGFLLNAETGDWEKNATEESAEDAEGEEQSSRKQRVIPFVEDRRNSLLYWPEQTLPTAHMATLQAALKNAIQSLYQLETSELAAEPLPDETFRRQLLFYESAEGGAGVLRRLLLESEALPKVAKEALRLLHFDAQGNDLHKADHARENCEAACYDCLLTYSNQHDHSLLDRHLIRDELLRLAGTHVVADTVGGVSREAQHEQLSHLAGSSLEQQWLDHLKARGHQLPTSNQSLIPACQTRPDFLYEDQFAAIYIDGPMHEYPERHQRDVVQQMCLEDLGYMVIRFTHADDWDKIIATYPNVFGKEKEVI